MANTSSMWSPSENKPKTEYRVPPEKNKVACKKYYYSHHEQQKERSRIKGPKYAANNHLRQRYGITKEDRENMLMSQGNKCKICGTTEPHGNGWAVDHDHNTGKIRGILCNKCNGGIGLLNDDANLVYTAACYLRDAKTEEQYV